MEKGVAAERGRVLERKGKWKWNVEDILLCYTQPVAVAVPTWLHDVANTGIK